MSAESRTRKRVKLGKYDDVYNKRINAIRAGAQAQFEALNGKRPSDPDRFDSPEDFVESMKWWDNFHADAFPRYCRNFEIGLQAYELALGAGVEK